jgi:hypothetical protein
MAGHRLRESRLSAKNAAAWWWITSASLINPRNRSPTTESGDQRVYSGMSHRSEARKVRPYLRLGSQSADRGSDPAGRAPTALRPTVYVGIAEASQPMLKGGCGQAAGWHMLCAGLCLDATGAAPTWVAQRRHLGIDSVPSKPFRNACSTAVQSSAPLAADVGANSSKQKRTVRGGAPSVV